MNFCFPGKRPSYAIKNKPHDWQCVWMILPLLFVGTETALFGETNKVWKLDFPTEIVFERDDVWHSFRISFLGFGFGYARQWGY